MRCRYAPVHDEVRGICDALGLDYDRIATDRAGMLWAGEGMPHRFDACCEISDIARRLRAEPHPKSWTKKRKSEIWRCGFS